MLASTPLLPRPPILLHQRLKSAGDGTACVPYALPSGGDVLTWAHRQSLSSPCFLLGAGMPATQWCWWEGIPGLFLWFMCPSVQHRHFCPLAYCEAKYTISVVPLPTLCGHVSVVRRGTWAVNFVWLGGRGRSNGAGAGVPGSPVPLGIVIGSMPPARWLSPLPLRPIGPVVPFLLGFF